MSSSQNSNRSRKRCHQPSLPYGYRSNATGRFILVALNAPSNERRKKGAHHHEDLRTGTSLRSGTTVDSTPGLSSPAGMGPEGTRRPCGLDAREATDGGLPAAGVPSQEI